MVAKNRKVFGFFGFLSLAICFPGFAQGDLLIFPKRLVFEGTQNRVQTLNLSNNGRDTATYRISYVENRMTESGGFEQVEVPDAGQQFASPYLRFFPRSITLAPGETQVVKVQLTKINQLAPGEYRSHLYFRAVPETKAREEKKDAAPTEDLSIRLTPVYGISIANIIRIGEPDVDVELSNLSLEVTKNNLPELSMDFQRTGSMSSYGDIKVTHTSLDGTETVVGEMKGVAVYTPGNLRKVTMKLKALEGVDYSTGTLEVSYSPQGNVQTPYDEASLNLQ